MNNIAQASDFENDQFLQDYFKLFKQIRFPTQKGYRYVKARDIIFLEANSNYTDIKLLSGAVLVSSRTLSLVAKKLPTTQFIQVHKSFFINVNYLTQYDHKNKTCLLITKVGKFELPVSNRMSKNLLF